MNIYNDYNYNENSIYWSMGHQIRYDLNHFRKDNKKAIDNQTEVLHEDITQQTQTQTEDAEKMRTNQTTLVGKIIDAAKSIFMGKSEKDGSEESFYQMVQRENTETQEWLEAQANAQKSSVEKLVDIIDSLDDIASDIVKDTAADKTNAEAIKNAIDDLKSKSVDIANAIKNFKPVNVNSVNI